MKTLCIFDKGTDPYWNLAAEEYLLKEFKQPVFRLWRNDNAIIVGCNQNTLAEIDAQFVKERGIKVVRRLSGGGAVFHDLGNLNYTFIEPRRYTTGSTANTSEEKGAVFTAQKSIFENPAEMFKRFTAPVIGALNNIGVPAYLHGRNDLLIDGRKFSGNAVCIWHNRVLQHGTLLFASNVADLSGALKARPEKFIGKSVASNSQRVTNISTYLPGGSGMDDVKEFGDYLMNYISGSGGIEAQPYGYSAEDIAAIGKLAAEKYSQEWWNYGKSPKYTFKNVHKFPWGLVEVYFDVLNGRINNLHIFGDYFSSRPTSELEALLEGTMHSVGEIEKVLETLPEGIEAYFSQACGENNRSRICNDWSISDFARMFY